MHLLLAAALVGLASTVAASVEMRSSSLLTRSWLDKRETCIKPDATCETCYGLGYVTCASDNNCYNPGAGDSCCSNGEYCPAGKYCTDAGCCPNGDTLDQCGATVSVSVIPPPAPEATSPGSSTSSTLAVQTESTVTTATTSSATITQISSEQPQAGTATTSSLPVFTGAANANNGKSGLALGAVIAAVAML